MAVIAFFRHGRAAGNKRCFAFDGFVLAIKNLKAIGSQYGPIAFLQINQIIGELRQRHGVRTNIHFSVADPDSERGARPRAKYLVLDPVYNHAKSVSPRELFQ